MPFFNKIDFFYVMVLYYNIRVERVIINKKSNGFFCLIYYLFIYSFITLS